MDFNTSIFSFNFIRFTSFDLYMWTLGLWLVFVMRRLPNICLLRQRWWWVSSRVLPLFRRLDRQEVGALSTHLSAMIRHAEVILGPEYSEASLKKAAAINR